MRNYITINGKNSNEINGLLIQELPPISKPQIRTEVEEIDGRDGDIVTKLGFAAYDKEFTVGLYKDFDINEIIAYFNSEGTVVFSNESDKYYNYQIIDQIDFERLVRYRTATVRMHCQPFKYSNTEGARTLGNKGTASGEGSFITLDNTSEAQFSKIDPKGNATQNGTPTPDSPQPISVVTGENVVKVVGKNLWDSELAVEYSNNSTVFITDGWLQFGTGARRLSCPLNIPVGSSVILTATIRSLVTTQNVVGFEFLYEDGTTANFGTAQILTDTDEHDFIASGTTTKKVVCIRSRYTSARDAQLKLDTIQLELGSVKSDFEPYQGQEFPIDLGSIELAKIGTYQDRIYKDGEKWYVEKQVGKVVLDSTWNWYTTAFSNAPDYVEYYTGAMDVLASYDNELAISDNFSNTGGIIAPSYVPTGECFSLKANAQSASYKLRFAVLKTTASTVSAFKTWLASNPTTVYYALATPTTTEITNEALIAQLEALYNQAHAYKGRTHITALAATGNAPHIIEAEVQRSSDGNITNNGNIVSKPTLTIYGSGNIGVSLNGYQILEITLGDEEYITIDTAAMEAYKDTLDNLKNRLVNGDYSKFALRPGSNMIEFSGIVSKCVISKYSRWL